MNDTREFDYDDAYELLRLVEATPELRRFSVQVGDFSLEIERQPGEAPAAGSAPVAAPSTQPGGAPAAPAPAEESGTGSGPDGPGVDEEEVRTSMAGVFYVASAPGAEPFVTVGDRVEPGDTIGIIEVMKLMNTVTTPFGGVVTAVLVRDSELVQFDQPLARIRRDGNR